MTTLSVYHQHRIDQARKRTDELHGKKIAQMSYDELVMWLTRMETTADDLLNVIAVTEIDAREARDDR